MFKSAVTEDQVLAFDIEDVDVVSNDKIGSATVPISDLLDFQEHAIDVNFSSAARKKCTIERKKSCQMFIRLLPMPPPEKLKKTVYFIRHGESKWNKSQSSHNVKGMLQEYDHGLSDKGCAEAEELAALTVSAEHATDPDCKRFMALEKVFVSPLTRAIQTAMLGLQHVPEMKERGVECLRDAREIKKVGGIDSCGTATGPQILQRVASEMAVLEWSQRKCHKADSGRGVPVKTVYGLDPNDALNHWWTAACAADSHQVGS
jgi:hypothetical protein